MTAAVPSLQKSVEALGMLFPERHNLTAIRKGWQALLDPARASMFHFDPAGALSCFRSNLKGVHGPMIH
jgi:hypothetical protein